MKTRLSILLFLITTWIFAQETIIQGTIRGEDNEKLNGVIVFNPKNEQKISPDENGNFQILASEGDKVRFVKIGYEIQIKTVAKKDLEKTWAIVLQRIPIDIEEVKIVFQPTGDLKKDLRNLKMNKKTERLKNELSVYIASGNLSKEIEPRLVTPSAFQGHDYSAGQIPILSIGGDKGIINHIFKTIFPKKQKLPQAIALDRNQFYLKVLQTVDMDYFFKNGLPEQDFDIFFDFALNHTELYSNYSKNFNALAIEDILKRQLPEYLRVTKL